MLFNLQIANILLSEYRPLITETLHTCENKQVISKKHTNPM